MSAMTTAKWAGVCLTWRQCCHLHSCDFPSPPTCFVCLILHNPPNKSTVCYVGSVSTVNALQLMLYLWTTWQLYYCTACGLTINDQNHNSRNKSTYKIQQSNKRLLINMENGNQSDTLALEKRNTRFMIKLQAN
jgi:hypothetical protein